MILYITLGTNNLAAATRFYDAVMPTLGLERRFQNDDEIGYGTIETDSPSRIRFWVTKPFNKEPATVGNGSMPALIAPTRAAVDAFHAAGLAAGGLDEGRPGLRPFGPNFYACYLRDPDGNKLSAVCEASLEA